MKSSVERKGVILTGLRTYKNYHPCVSLISLREVEKPLEIEWVAHRPLFDLKQFAVENPEKV